MDVLQKLRSLVVPEQKRMTKAQLLQFYEENRILERMQLYYNKPTGARKVRSKVAVPVSDDDEDPVPSSMAALAKLPASKIRKMLREFAKDLGVQRVLADSCLVVVDVLLALDTNRNTHGFIHILARNSQVVRPNDILTPS